MRARRSVVRWALPVALAFVAPCAGADDAGKAEAKDEPAAAASVPLRYAKSYLAAMTEARDRGCVVFATFHGDG
jgi:hypothetical protein